MARSKRRSNAAWLRDPIACAVETLESRVLLSTYMVTNNLDSGPGSLRTDIQMANTDPGPDTITFDPAVFAAPQIITLTAGELPITDTSGITTLTGPAGGVVISGNHASRVFDISAGASANISGVTIRDGSSSAPGGGIFNGGTLILSNATVADNMTFNAQLGTTGGGILNSFNSNAVLTNVTISGNSASGGGGMINAGTATLTDVTISNNAGGGLDTFGTATLTNVTIAENTSENVSGILNNNGATKLTLTNCTISGNTSTGGAAMDTSMGGTAVLRNTIVAGNFGGGPDEYGALDPSSSHNLIGGDPMVGRLGDYGGSLQTVPLLPGSPAIDAGSDSLAVGPDRKPLATDERGLPRIYGAHVDIGAYEYQPLAGGGLTAASISGVYGGTVTLMAHLTESAVPVSGEIVQFSLNGMPVGSTKTDISGNATLGDVSLAGINAGQYPTAVSATFPGDSSYAAAAAVAALTVTKAHLTVTADDQQKVVGSANPTLTYTLRGFVNGADASSAGVTGAPLLNTTASASSPPGIYPITVVSPGTLATANYDFPSLVNGTLIVTHTPLLVTTSSDSGPGSLRQAILDANEAAGPDIITFAIGSGPQSVTLLSPLPAISDPLILDATTQPGYSGTPLIELNGSRAGSSANGLTLQAADCTVRGFVINRFAGAGVAIFPPYGTSASSEVIQGNYIGTDESGSTAKGNGTGVLLGNGNLSSSSILGALIGGTQPGERNLISGNTGAGITMEIQGGNISGVLIEGNYIGTDALGSAAVPNRGDGISAEFNAQDLRGSTISGNTIGGTVRGAGNVISGNAGNGVLLTGGYRHDCALNLIEGNYIGTNASGTAAVPNAKNGVDLEANYQDTIGGAASGAGNRISGNTLDGVLISHYGGFNASQAGNGVVGNTIGLTAAGGPLGNGAAGVHILGTSATVSRNSIDFNGGRAIVEDGLLGALTRFSIAPVLTAALTSSAGTTITGIINPGRLPVPSGTLYRIEFFSSPASDPSAYGVGRTYLGRATTVIYEPPGSASFTFFTTVPLTGTVITATYATPSLNYNPLVTEEFTSTFSNAMPVTPGTVVTIASDGGPDSLRQAILDANADPMPETVRFAIGSGHEKIVLSSPLSAIDTPVTIDATNQPGYTGAPLIELSGSGAGPTAAGLVLAAGHCSVTGLVINWFGAGGIQLEGSNETIEGNYIGTDASGAAAVANGAAGVIITSATNTVSSNVVSGNGGDGIDLQGAGAIGNMILGNRIGTTASGAAVLGNSGAGILLDSGPAKNTIGGTSAAAANVISGNADGIHLRADQTVGNLIAGNFIGTDTTGKTALPNRSNGVELEGAQANSIGDTTAGAGNSIAYNAASGIVVTGASATGNSILGNSIHDNQKLGIDLGADGVTPNGPAGLSRSGPNQLQNFPVISLAIPGSITGTLSAVANSAFRIELFSSPAADPSGFGQGQKYLGSVTVNTDASGTGSFSSTPGSPLVVGQFITATATDPAGNTSEFSAARVVLPSAPPQVTAAVFDYSHSFPTLTFTFSKSVTASVIAAGLGTIMVQDLTTGTSVSPAFFSYNGTNNTVLYTFPGPLADGNYRATLLASVISDSDGNHLDGKGDNVPGQDYNFPFFFLRGDVNHDGTVDFTDLVALARNYRKQNATWSDGDFNYDGSVGFDDLLILARNYGRTVAAAAPAASPIATATFGTRPSAAMEYALAAVPTHRRLAHIRTRHLSLL